MKSFAIEAIIFALTSFRLLCFVFIPFLGSFVFCVPALPVTFCTWYPFFNLINFFRRFLFLHPVTATRGWRRRSADTWAQLQMHVAFGASSFPLFRLLSIGHRGGVGRGWVPWPGTTAQQQLRQRPEYSHPSEIYICSVLQRRPIQLLCLWPSL